jgi:hypothetical protein
MILKVLVLLPWNEYKWQNKVNEDTQKRIMADNWAYFAFIKLFRSRLMSKDTKMKLYKAHKTSGRLQCTSIDFENCR